MTAHIAFKKKIKILKELNKNQLDSEQSDKCRINVAISLGTMSFFCDHHLLEQFNMAFNIFKNFFLYPIDDKVCNAWSKY